MALVKVIKDPSWLNYGQMTFECWGRVIKPAGSGVCLLWRSRSKKARWLSSSAHNRLGGFCGDNKQLFCLHKFHSYRFA